MYYLGVIPRCLDGICYHYACSFIFCIYPLLTHYHQAYVTFNEYQLVKTIRDLVSTAQ